jgi:predicted nuclease of predicted toxin-antitoxin system
LRDREVVTLAKLEGRVIVTFDLDFGEIYHAEQRGRVGVIILRIRDQTVDSVNRVLERFFESEAANIPLERSLVIIEETRVRIVREG